MLAGTGIQAPTASPELSERETLKLSRAPNVGLGFRGLGFEVDFRPAAEGHSKGQLFFLNFALH